MIKVFTDISELYTLKAAAAKDGRKVVEKDLSRIRKAALVSERGKVLWAGPQSKLPRYKNAKRISLAGAVVIPAFVECHTHSVFAGDRAEEFELRNTGVSYAEISRRGGGILSTVRDTRKASLSELSQLVQKRADLFVEQGVTTLEVKSGYGLRLKDELKMLEAAKSIKGPDVVTTYLGAHALPKEYKTASDYIERLLKDLPKVAKSRLADRADIFIEKGFFELPEGKKYLERAKEFGLKLTVHADQLHRTGAGRLAAELGAQSADHLVQISTADKHYLARSETTCVLLPAADFYLKMNYPPARRLIDAGARVAIATDFNPGSSPTQDLALVGLLARLEMKMSLPEVLTAYTFNAAGALGMSDKKGSLEVGKSCDFSVLNGDLTELFYHAGRSSISEVYKSGRRLWRARPRS